ncbi:MAG: MBL fold metallo-hydrolase [Promethearchaeota archaeon]
MVSIQFFGGVDEIGGNKIFIKQGDTKIFLDFGMSFKKEGDYFEFPLLRPTNKEDLFKLKLLPEITGLYQNQGLYPIYNKEGSFSLGGSPQSKGIDAVFISHAHLDHYGYIGTIREDIPIYMSEITKKFIELRSKVGNTQWNTTTENLIINPLDKAKELKMGDISVQRYDVDHSVLGASGYIIRALNKRIAYTGDFRFHGYRENLTKEFMDAIKGEHLDILITEGTRVPDAMKKSTKLVESHSLNSEKEVFNKCVEAVSNEDGLVIYDCSPADLDRFRTLWKVAKKTGRTLVVDSKKSYLVLYINAEKHLVDDMPKVGDFLIYLNRLKFRKGRVFKDFAEGRDIYAEAFEYYRSKHEAELTVLQQINTTLKKKKTKEDLEKQHDNLNLIEIPNDNFIWGPSGRQHICDNSNEFIIITSSGMNTMLQFKPPDGGLDGTYIYGKAEPFNEEMRLSFKRLMNWLKMCNLKLEYAHTSGHLGYDAMKEFIAEVKPDRIIPIHTENPKIFSELTKVQILSPEFAKVYSF